MAASLAAEPEGARLKGVIVGAPDTRRLGVQPDPRRPRAGRRDRLPRLQRPGRHHHDGPRAGPGGPERGRPAAVRRARRPAPALLGVSLDDLSALTSGEHAIVVTGGAKPGAALALKVEDGAAARTRRSTSSASASRRCCGRSAPTRRSRRGSRCRSPRASRAGACRSRPRPAWSTAWTATWRSSAPACPPSRRCSARPPRCRPRPTTRRASSGMPDAVTSVLWVNIQEAVATADKLGALDGRRRRRRSRTCGRSRASRPGRPAATPRPSRCSSASPSRRRRRARDGGLRAAARAPPSACSGAVRAPVMLAAVSKSVRRKHADGSAPLHLGVRHRGAPRQDRRPDLGRRPRRGPHRRPDGPGRLRDADHHGPGDGRRGDLHLDLRGHPVDRARDDPQDRLHPRQVRLRRRDLRRVRGPRRAEPGHRPGRRTRPSRRAAARRAGTPTTSRAPATRA